MAVFVVVLLVFGQFLSDRKMISLFVQCDTPLIEQEMNFDFHLFLLQRSRAWGANTKRTTEEKHKQREVLQLKGSRKKETKWKKIQC